MHPTAVKIVAPDLQVGIGVLQIKVKFGGVDSIEEGLLGAKRRIGMTDQRVDFAVSKAFLVQLTHSWTRSGVLAWSWGTGPPASKCGK